MSKPENVVDVQKPSNVFVKAVYRQSKIFTAVAIVFCGLLYYGISKYYGGEVVQTQARFNTAFQALLVSAWTWFMFPYIRVTLQMMLYGLALNERTAAFFCDPKDSPLIQYMEKRLGDERKTIQPLLDTWTRIGERVEAELPSIIKKVHENADEIKISLVKLNSAMEKNEAIAAEAKPAIEALRRIQGSIEGQIKAGFFEKADMAFEAVRGISGLPKKEEDLVSPDWALESLRRNKLKAGGAKS